MSTTLDAPTAAGSPKQSPVPRGTPLVWRVLKPLASLQLTVALFVLSLVLVFFGTLAQIDMGTQTVTDEYFRNWYVWVPTQLIAKFGWKFFEYPAPDAVWSGHFLLPGGWVVGGLMAVNLLAAHVMRFKLSWRRAGIITIHLGVLLLLLGELITGLCAVESRMALQVGESTNFIDHSRRVELAFTDPATGRDVVVPHGLLRANTLVTDPQLPVDVEVVEVLKNTDLRPASGGDDVDGVVRFDGVRFQVVPASEGAGVKSEREDAAAVRVRLFRKGTQELLAERLLSLWQYENYTGRQYISVPPEVVVDGKPVRCQLRNERIVKPYTVELLQFEHKQYVGTDMPKDFASTVHLTDPETGDDRQVRIWMNHPLRHRGETFYQHSTIFGDTGTVLQVVKNPGWLLPYVSCLVVALGMLVHFGMNLSKFTSRVLESRAAATAAAPPDAQRPDAADVPPPGWHARLATYFPWAVVGVFGLYVAAQMYPKPVKYEDYDLSAFGAIPVLDGGRIKPLDSIARTNLLHISGRSEFRDADGNSRPAILWLLQLLAAGDPNASPVADYEVFRIDNEQLLAELGLREKPNWYRYSWNELRKAAERFDRLFIAARTREDKKERGEKVPDDVRDILHGKVIELAGRLRAYEQLAGGAAPTLIPKEKGSDLWFSLATIDEIAGQPYENEALQQAASQVASELQAKGIDPQTVTPAMKSAMRREMERRAKVMLRQIGARERKSVSPAAAAFGDILAAYKGHRPKAFSEAIAAYRADYVDPVNPALPDTTRFELAFNAAAPFYYAAWLYLFAAVLRIFGWMGWTNPLRRAALGVALLGVALNAAGLLGRMYLMDRPLVFVTNLYSSALLIACGAVAACLYVERLFKNGIALVAGCLLGAFAVGVAHHLSTDGKDTLGKLQAVLDTNLWLASHVTTVTLGYSATYIAGVLGLAYIAWGLFLPTLTREKHAALGNMIYGVTCFATMLSFIGTVLGGIWADQSWGRFWGWDPKENGAVLIVIWNSLILHARWSGLVKQRGVAVLAVIGIIVTTWSWFGTNQLEVGLHAYGFNKSLADGCRYTWLASLVAIGVGLIPLRYWRSFGNSPTAPAAAYAVTTTEGEPAAGPKPAANGQPPTNGSHIPAEAAKGKKSGKRR